MEYKTDQIAAAALTAKRLLVVDDNAANQKILTKMLADWGIEHQVASEGQATIRALEKAAAANNPFDFLLMDCQMPHMNGFDASRRIKETSRHIQCLHYHGDRVHHSRRASTAQIENPSGGRVSQLN